MSLAAIDQRLKVTHVPRGRPETTLAEAVRRGLSHTPRTLPSMLFYDQAGSELFDSITELPEYTLTRSERSILLRHADEMVAAIPDLAEIVEFGSGSGEKTRIVLDAALATGPVRYVPIDVSGQHLEASMRGLLVDRPTLSAHALVAEYFDGLRALPKPIGPRAFMFMGSNIGNLTTDEATEFLKLVRREIGEHDRLFVGVDLVKDLALMRAAYNDSSGVTAKFNKNLLARLNRELGASFDLDAFDHLADWFPESSRIEMRLVSRTHQMVTLGNLGPFVFQEDEWIRTEVCHKYTPTSIKELGSTAGFKMVQTWTDDPGWFMVAAFGAEIGR